jgi:RNA polymerase sigma-70 factor (ECF subfamily)
VASLPAVDEQLLRALYNEHADALLMFVRRLVKGDEGRAEDVVQEVLLRAWQHPQAFDSDARSDVSVRGWLYAVARNLVIDGQRARRARPAEITDIGVEPGDLDPALDHVLVQMEVSDAVATLSPDHRAVVGELYFRDRSVAETAVLLGVPAGTVKSRAYYALRALRVACEERGITP